MELHFRTPLKTVSLTRVSTIEFPQRVLAFLSPVLHVLRNSHPFPQICRYNQNIGLPLVAVSSLVLGNETGRTLWFGGWKCPVPIPTSGRNYITPQNTWFRTFYIASLHGVWIVVSAFWSLDCRSAAVSFWIPRVKAPMLFWVYDKVRDCEGRAIQGLSKYMPICAPIDFYTYAIISYRVPGNICLC